jgi:hypothetical protein
LLAATVAALVLDAAEIALALVVTAATDDAFSSVADPPLATILIAPTARHTGAQLIPLGALAMLA